jgi:hypothetical protein
MFLPESKQALLQQLFNVLYEVSKDANANMTALSLASIIAPLILRKGPSDQSTAALKADGSTAQSNRKTYRYSGVADPRDIEIVQLRLKIEELQETIKTTSNQRAKQKETIEKLEEKIKKLNSLIQSKELFKDSESDDKKSIFN